MTCTPSGWNDPDGDGANYYYAWYDDDTGLVAGQASSTFDCGSVGNCDKGDTITCEVTPFDGTVNGSTVNAITEQEEIKPEEYEVEFSTTYSGTFTNTEYTVGAIGLSSSSWVPDYDQIIRKAREKRGLSQKDFANKLNEKESIVQKMETKTFKPSIKMAEKLQRILGIKLIETVEMEKVKQGKTESGVRTIGDMIKIK